MKKILENEILNDDELENISVGTKYQMYGDYDFLVDYLGYAQDRHELKKIWSKVGIRFKGHTNLLENEYFLGGSKISRKDAFRHVMRQRGWNDVAIDCFDFDNLRTHCRRL